MIKKSLAALLLLTLGTAQAATIEAYVVSILDGDTLTALTDDKQQIKVRVKGIDAPEKHQAFGQKAKTSLSAMTFNQRVRLECGKQDRYKRSVCYVFNQQGTDVGLEQVKRGMAWWYQAYAKEQTLEERERYQEAETWAKLHREGLWVDSKAVAPWDYRKGER